MEFVRQYLISIIVASVIVGIVSRFINKKNGNFAVIRLICGIFLSFTILNPLFKLKIEKIGDFYIDITENASSFVSEGKEVAVDAAGEIIKEKLQAYILDKASTLQLDVGVELTLDENLPPSPQTVTIVGDISPYAKNVLSAFLEKEIGIAKENQQWR